MTEIVPINSIKKNPDNPRTIKNSKFKKLVKSIKDFPDMLNIRPVVIVNNTIIGGNMRYDACKEAGLKTISVIRADNLSENQIKEFIIKDNMQEGEWNFEKLSSDWNMEQLIDWGFEEWEFGIEIPENIYASPGSTGIVNSIDNNEDNQDNNEVERKITCPECGHEFTA